MANKAPEKKNIFGKKEVYWGINVLIAILNVEWVSIGIPPYEIPKLISIMEKVLDKRTVEILKLGFGIEVKRITQKEIAELYGLKASEVSGIAHEAITKLQKSPFKGQIKALAPSLEELFDLAEKGRVQTGNVLELKAQNAELRSTIGRNKLALESKELQINRLNGDVESLEKTVKDLESKIERQNAVIADQEKEMEEIKNLHNKISRLLQPEAASPEAQSEKPWKVNLPKKLADKLRKLGVVTTADLIRLSPSSLSRLGVSQDEVKLIKSTLEARGLFLRK